MEEIRAPVFVKVEEYKDVADIVSLMRAKISQARIILDKISELKAKEDAELASWSKELGEIESRIHEIDRMVFQ